MQMQSPQDPLYSLTVIALKISLVFGNFSIRQDNAIPRGLSIPNPTAGHHLQCEGTRLWQRGLSQESTHLIMMSAAK